MKNGFPLLITLITVLLITTSHPVFADEAGSPSEDSQTGKLVINNFEYYERLIVVDLVPWLILILTIILVKANRTPKALLILIPLLAANLIRFVLKMFLRIPSSQDYLFDLPFVCLIVGISILMLLAHKRPSCNRFFTFLWAVAVSVFIGAAVYLSSCGLTFNRDMMILIMFYLVGVLAVLIGFVFAAHCCRKYYSPIRFTICLAFCTPAGAILAMLVYAAIVISIMAVTQSLPTSLISMVKLVLVVGLVSGGILYVIELPFIILTLNCSFFRKRFHECFRLKGMDFEREKVPAPEHIILTKAPEKKENAEDKVSNKWMDPPRPSD